VILTTYSGLFRRQLRPDNGRIWRSSSIKKHAGFYGVMCIYCKSPRIMKNGNRINTYQRCQPCNNIFSIPPSKFKLSSLPSLCCPHCSDFNDIRLVRSWRCTECNRSFYDENRIWGATRKKHIGFHGVRCKYCNSTLTRKNGKKIRTAQHCQACMSIFYVPVNRRLSNLPTVGCPQYNVSNKIRCMEMHGMQ
jgi:DNA-directed RNA polymerase subunit RPC12/RpoP